MVFNKTIPKFFIIGFRNAILDRQFEGGTDLVVEVLRLAVDKLDKWFIPEFENCEISYRLDGSKACADKLWDLLEDYDTGRISVGEFIDKAKPTLVADGEVIPPEIDTIRQDGDILTV